MKCVSSVGTNLCPAKNKNDNDDKRINIRTKTVSNLIMKSQITG